MKVAVTGGTGFVGSHLVDRLVAEGHQVTVVVHERPGESYSRDDVTETTGSVDDPASLEKALREADAVYHLVGIIAETRTKTFERTVVGGTLNVVAACQRAGVRRLIYLSAIGADENAATKYHRTKYNAEQLVISSGIDYVILRPSVVYGLGDGFVSLLKRLIDRFYFTPVIGSGRYLLQPVYIDDLVSALVQSLTLAEASGEIIEIGGPEKLQYLEILNIIKRVTGKARVNFHVPMGVMKPVAYLLESSFKPAPITVDQLTMMEMGNTGDISKMKAIFSIHPVKFEDGLRKYLRWENG